MRYLFSFLNLLLLGSTLPGLAQTASSDAIAAKAYAARADHFYLMAGAALPNYSKLNDLLGPTAYPSLRRGALVYGAGYGQSWGRFGLQLEWRFAVRSNEADSTKAYTNLTSSTWSLLARYHLLVSRVYALSAFIGPSYSTLSLGFKDPDPDQGASTSVTGRLRSHGDKHQFYQGQLLGSLGAQFDRHFSWGRRNDLQACGRARQITVGLRLQYDYRLRHGRWRTERAIYRRAVRLEDEPLISPLGGSATLVVGGLFNRF